jgi:hypothetical protein
MFSGKLERNSEENAGLNLHKIFSWSGAKAYTQERRFSYSQDLA